MILEFYNTNFETVGIVSDIFSLTWKRRKKALGEFEAVIAFEENMLEFLKTGNIVMRSDRDDLMILTDVEIARTDGNLYSAKIKGIDFMYVLQTRVQTAIFDFLPDEDYIVFDDLIDGAIKQNFSSQFTTSARAIDQSIVIELDNEEIYNDPNYDYEQKYIPERFLTVYEYIMALLIPRNYGMIARYAGRYRDKPLIDFKIVTMHDKTDKLIFSDETQNLDSWAYVRTISDNPTSAVVAGKLLATEYEAERPMVYVGSGSGLARRETYVDGTDIDRTWSTGREISAGAYRNMLREAGRSELSKTYVAAEINAETKNVVFSYPDDFDLGDIASIKTLVAEGRATIVEITEIFDDSGHSVFPVFEIEPRYNLITENGKNLVTEDGEKRITTE